MEIKYTYQEPEEKPIESAEFESSYGTECRLATKINGEIALSIIGVTISLNKKDFADFTKLINRINKQIGNEG